MAARVLEHIYWVYNGFVRASGAIWALDEMWLVSYTIGVLNVALWGRALRRRDQYAKTTPIRVQL